MTQEKTLEEELQELRDSEEKKYSENWEYQRKNFEILEWEIREVKENEGQLIRENPLDFPPSVQRKYFSASADDWNFPPSVDPDGEVPDGYFLDVWIITNPYTKEEKAIYEHRPIPVPPQPSKTEIWDKILQEVFDGNPYAQIADLTKSQVTTLYLLVPIIGKETVKVAYADLIQTLNKVSEARVASWLEPFDLSFLD